jgi:hypothetical protein
MAPTLLLSEQKVIQSSYPVIWNSSHSSGSGNKQSSVYTLSQADEFWKTIKQISVSWVYVAFPRGEDAVVILANTQETVVVV